MEKIIPLTIYAFLATFFDLLFQYVLSLDNLPEMIEHTAKILTLKLELPLLLFCSLSLEEQLL